MRILIFIFSIFLFSCTTENRNASLIESTPIVTVLGNETIDFGTIIEGETIDLEFRIKNTGSGSLIITNAKASCGCTKLDFPKEIIKEGEVALIKVTFDSKNKSGMQNKKITLTTNAIPNIKILTIKGEVIPQKIKNILL